jgi:hypothetical protein
LPTDQVAVPLEHNVIGRGHGVRVTLRRAADVSRPSTDEGFWMVEPDDLDPA